MSHKPLRLSDSQLDQIFRAGQPLRPADRDAYLQRIAEVLRDCPKPGDGDVYRAVTITRSNSSIHPVRPRAPRPAPSASLREVGRAHGVLGLRADRAAA